MTTNQIRVRVAEVETVAAEIRRLKLVPIGMSGLPDFSGGAHTILSLEDGERTLRNPYSLMSSPYDTSSYEVSVLKAAASRGGSAFIHEKIREGLPITISAPVNLFPVDRRARRHILIAGGTSTGKTTLANALLAEIAVTGDRVLVLEDTIELQCAARDHVPLRTRAGVVSMTELVRATMRLRPDRVVVGEVRGGEALDLVKVWGTGHPGGIATIHAGSALGALLRLEQLVLEVAVNPPRALIAEAVNVVVFIVGRGRKRRIETISRVAGFDGAGYSLSDVLETPFPELFPPSSIVPSLSLNPSGELP